MGAKNGSTKNTQQLSKSDIIAILLYTRTGSTGVNMFGKKDFDHFAEDDMICMVKSVIHDQKEFAKLVRTNSSSEEQYSGSEEQNSSSSISRTLTMPNQLNKSKTSAFRDVKLQALGNSVVIT